MSVDIEPAGALATAGMAAKELEGDAGKATAKPAHAGARCANCGTLLTGAYCHSCGQAAHVHRSLLHILEELGHGILHFDTKSWRTLPLLVARPGLLTRRYIDGQRARYVSPLALFLFSVFLMFFVFSMLSESPTEVIAKASVGLEDARRDLSREVDQARKLVAQREIELAQARTDAERETATENLSDARSDLKQIEATLAGVAAVPTTDAKGQPTSPGEITRKSASEALAKSDIDVKYPRIARLIHHAIANPELTTYKVKNSAYKFAFMLVPLSLPFLWLMFFWRRDVVMYDHAIFTLYGLSFLSLWCSLMALVVLSPFTRWLEGLMVLYVPVHVFLQLKETYSLGFAATIWRTIALLVAGGIVLIVFVLMVLAISLG